MQREEYGKKKKVLNIALIEEEHMPGEEKENDLQSIFRQKRILQSQVWKTLNFVDPSLRSCEDNAIQNIVLEAPWFNSSHRLCAHISCSTLREVDTLKLLSQILQIPCCFEIMKCWEYDCTFSINSLL